MRLYTLTDAESVEHEGVEYKIDKEGSIELPHDFAVFLRNQHINGKKAWEDDAERAVRVDAENAAKKASPEHLADLVEELTAKVEAGAKIAEPVADVPVDKPAAKKAGK